VHHAVLRAPLLPRCARKHPHSHTTVRHATQRVRALECDTLLYLSSICVAGEAAQGMRGSRSGPRPDRGPRNLVILLFCASRFFFPFDFSPRSATSVYQRLYTYTVTDSWSCTHRPPATAHAAHDTRVSTGVGTVRGAWRGAGGCEARRRAPRVESY
jgi:hypothetical protein